MALELTSESSWEEIDTKQTKFGVIRFHFRLDDVPLGEPHKVGDYIGVYQKPKDAQLRIVKSEKTELERIEFHKSIENHLIYSEHIAELANEFVVKNKLSNLLRFDVSIKTKIIQKLSATYASTVELSTSEKITKTETIEIENELGSTIDETIVSVPVYKRRATDITLVFIDYLTVDYAPSIFGLRRRAKKRPQVTHPKKHPNRIPFGTPVGRAYYWQLLPTSSKFIPEREHKIEVINPLQVIIESPHDITPRSTHFPKVPTLYQIASVAFPKKWIFRKPKNREWTEDQLKAIELEEFKRKWGPFKF